VLCTVDTGIASGRQSKAIQCGSESETVRHSENGRSEMGRSENGRLRRLDPEEMTDPEARK
jgi:hypothetical protein